MAEQNVAATAGLMQMQGRVWKCTDRLLVVKCPYLKNARYYV